MPHSSEFPFGAPAPQAPALQREGAELRAVVDGCRPDAVVPAEIGGLLAVAGLVIVNAIVAWAVAS